MSATPQGVLACYPVRHALAEYANRFPAGCVSRELAAVCEHVWTPNAVAFAPRTFRRLVAERSSGRELMPLTPHDVFLALRTILGELFSDLARIGDDDPVRRRFPIHTVTVTQCLGAGCAALGMGPTTRTEPVEPVLVVTVPQQDAVIELGPVRTAKRVWPPPDNFVIHLQRTRYSDAGQQVKVSTRVRVPLVSLTVRRLFARPDDAERPVPVVYRAISAGYHQGDTPHDGHYWALVRGTEPPPVGMTYRRINDACVTRADDLPASLRWESDVSARRVAFVVLERVSPTERRNASHSESANRFAAPRASSWVCSDVACGHVNAAGCKLCARCRQWPCPAACRGLRGRHADGCWDCPRCTFLNFGTADRVCAVCKFRPPTPRGARQPRAAAPKTWPGG
eukprot:gene11260-5771_t